MSSVSFTVSHRTQQNPTELWSRLSRGDTRGWPVLRECRRLELGAPILFTLPDPRGAIVQATGRIDHIIEGEEIGIRQESPWQGRLRLQLRTGAEGTDVRLRITIDDDCIPWFGAHLGDTTPVATEVTPSRPGLRIGLLVCLSGPAGIFGRSVANAAQLAVDELNRSASIGSRAVELVVVDDHTSATAAKSAFTRLVATDRCEVVITNVSSASVRAIQPIARRTGTLVLNAALSEGDSTDHTFLRLGETPLDQLLHSIPVVMSSTGASNWFILGSDYVWPRTMGSVASRVIDANGGRVEREHYQRMGTTDFDQVIDSITRSDADVILSSLVGVDAVRFERAFHESGNRGQFTTLATIMDDAVREHIGSEAASGIWSVQDYFTTTGEVDEVTRRYDQRFGTMSPRLTSMAKSTYDTVHLYADAVARAHTTVARDVAAQIAGGSIGSERLRRRIRGLVTPTPIAIATAGGFVSVRSS